jgi:hypothetical protein
VEAVPANPRLAMRLWLVPSSLVRSATTMRNCPLPFRTQRETSSPCQAPQCCRPACAQALAAPRPHPLAGLRSWGQDEHGRTNELQHAVPIRV